MAAGRKTGGRKKGTPNKATADIKALAREYGEESIEGIVMLARTAENEQTRFSAWKELLDRGYGKPGQPIAGDADNPIVHEVRHVVVGRPDG